MVDHRPRRPSTAFLRRHWLLAAVLLLRLIAALPVLTYGAWRSHEADYYTVARTLSLEQRLPTAADAPDRPGVILQAAQPPLYFAVMVPILALFDTLDPVPPPSVPSAVCLGWAEANPTLSHTTALNDAAYYATGTQSPLTARFVLRLLNLIMTAAAVISLYAAVRRLIPQQSAAILSAAVLAFEPNTLQFTTIIGNDALLLMISAVYVYLASRILTRAPRPVWDWGGIGLLTLLAALTRLNGWALLPATVILILLQIPWGRSLPVRMRRRVLLGIGVLCLLTAALLVINRITTGSVFGRYRELETVLIGGLSQIGDTNALVTTVAAVLRYTGVESYLSAVGFIQRPHAIEAFGWVSLILLGAGLTVGMYILWCANRRGAVMVGVLIGSALLLVLARHAAALTVTTADSTTLIFAPLRYYVTGLPALALVIGVAMARLKPVMLIGIGVFCVWLAVPILSPDYQTRTPQGQLSPVSASEITSDDEVFPRLVSSTWTIDPQTHLIRLQLATAVDQPLAAIPSARIEFITPEGHTTSCQFPLTELPPQQWPVGNVLETQVSIPTCVSTLSEGSAIRLRWVSGGESVLLGVLEETLPRSTTCPPLLGTFGDGLAVIRYTAPLMQHTGQLYLPAVNWYSLAATSAVSRTYFLTQPETGIEITCVSEPRLDSYPFSAWKLGETVYFDECPMQIPADTPSGAYQVSIRLQDANGQALPAFDPSGARIPDSRLPVAAITLTH